MQEVERPNASAEMVAPAERPVESFDFLLFQNIVFARNDHGTAVQTYPELGDVAPGRILIAETSPLEGNRRVSCYAHDAVTFHLKSGDTSVPVHGECTGRTTVTLTRDGVNLTKRCVDDHPGAATITVIDR